MIIILFSTPRKRKVISRIIRKVEGTEFSHISIAIFNKRIQRYVTFEAAGLLTRCLELENWKHHNFPIKAFEIPCDTALETKILTKAIDTLGRPYGKKQLIGLLFVRLFGTFNIRIKNPFSDGNSSYVCSEYVGHLLKDLGFNLGDLDTVTPKDIYEVLEHGEIIQK